MLRAVVVRIDRRGQHLFGFRMVMCAVKLVPSTDERLRLLSICAIVTRNAFGLHARLPQLVS